MTHIVECDMLDPFEHLYLQWAGSDAGEWWRVEFELHAVKTIESVYFFYFTLFYFSLLCFKNFLENAMFIPSVNNNYHEMK